MPRYAPLPVHDSEDQELNRAFSISDDEDDNARDHTPLLARPEEHRDRSPGVSRTPRTATNQRTIDGRYNFEYDFPPPGSPPRELAGPNHWGNTNGIVVSEPVRYNPSSNTSWLSRTWATITGRGNRGTETIGHSIGGGTSNDGVFFNLSSRPTLNRPIAPVASSQDAPAEPESIFHAPEIARDDAPPSYYAAQADVAPAYTVLTTAPDDFMIESLPAGSLLGFFWAFTISLFLEWIGFVLAYMLSTTHAGRCGAKAGLGISFVRLGLWFRNRADSNDPSSGGGPEDMWWGALDALNVTVPLPTHVPGSFNMTTNIRLLYSDYNATVPNHHGAVKGMSSSPITQWVAIFLMTVGWFIFMTSILQFWRVKKWERGIRASTQAAQVAPQDHQLLSNLQIALGLGTAVHSNARDQSAHDAEIDQLELERQQGIAHPEENEEAIEEADRHESQLRRDLTSLGYL